MILKLPQWKLFVLLLIQLIILSLDLSYWLEVLLDSIAYLFIFGWFLLVGINLNDKLDKERKSDFVFIFNCIFSIVFVTLSSILDMNEDEAQMPTILLILASYFVFAYLHIVYFVSRAFILVQKFSTARSRLSEMTVFLSFFVFIIGIWILQPRIQKIFS